jgi:hypothetical protein
MKWLGIDLRPVTGHQKLCLKVATQNIKHILLFTVYSMDCIYMELKFDSSWDNLNFL